MKHAFLVEADALASAARGFDRYFFATACGATAASALLLLLWGPAWSGAALAWLVTALLALSACSGWALRATRQPGFRSQPAICAVALAALALTGITSFLLGAGLRSPVFGFCAVIVCVAGAVSSIRCGIAMVTLVVVELAALGWAETRGMVGVGRALAPLAMVLVYQALIVGCAAIGAFFIAAALRRNVLAATEREQRFRGLLRITADWYWEQDRDFRFTRMAPASAGGEIVATADPAEPLVNAPWEASGLELSDDQLDAHRADLEAHQPFSALLARQRDAHGRWRTVSVSGEPRFDANGMFDGYWGVARDVSDELRVQQSVTASETRYRELFTRSPSPLFLHRRGVVFDANEAAARLFGFEDAAQMNGFDILELYPAGSARERAMRDLATLEGMPIGEGLPISDFQIRALDARALSVQSTAVRVDTASGPANLAIVYDITARQAVEGALRRSEAMLSHLFATSPDAIALADMASGRYAMVNPAFCRVTGFGAAEVVGRTGAELGLWADPRDFARLVARLESDGTVHDLPAVLVAKSGTPLSMVLGAGHFVMDRRDYLVVTARDVTDSERTRREHAAILQRASIGIAFTRDSRFVQANPYFERMFGWNTGALAGQADSVVWPTEAEHAGIGALVEPLLEAGQPFEAERLMRRRDGSSFWCRLLAQAVDRDDPSRGGTIWIAEDVTERRRMDAALAAARDAAEAANRAKSAFLANTSHEIRTPLNGLLGLARLATQPELPPGRRDTVLAQILDSAQGLAGIMSDILDFSKIEAGKFTLEDAPFALRDALVAVHHAYLPLAEVKGLELTLAIDAALPVTVRGDAARLRQILANFITNAIKFTERGEVHIEVGATASGRLQVAVSDTGPGLTEQLQGELFVPFSQGDTSTTRRHGGTGLGLSICRELAQMMGGSVGVESRAGHGSTFWAELPLCEAAAAPPEPSTEAGDLARLRGARVLMAEDNPVNMMIVVALLEHWGVQVAQAGDGREAVAAVHAAAHAGQPFHAVLMDLQMPLMGGREATRRLREHYDADTLPIIALTAAALVLERDEALAAGMNDFLTKPIDAPKLRHALARRVARAA